MSNTLTGLIPTIMTALDTVMRERVGFIPAVSINPSSLQNSGALKAAKDQTVRFPVVPQGSLENITPGATPADSGGQVMGYDDLTLDKAKAYPVLWSGEEQLGVSEHGQYNIILADQFKQAFRTFANEIDADLAAKYIYASLACGTAGTAPFGTAADFSDFANVHKIFDDNGVPTGDLHLVLNSAAIANIRGKQSGLFKANEAGTEELLRKGIIGQVEGLNIHTSAQIKTHTKGTGSGFKVNLEAGYSVGDVEITVDTGTGTILAGDVVTFAGDTNKYVVATALSSGKFSIAAPGLKKALADDTAVTVTANHACNMAFDRNALVLITRAPAVPGGGDSADDRTIVTDPLTGLAFEVALYKQYKRIKYEVGLVWGTKAVKTESMGLLMG